MQIDETRLLQKLKEGDCFAFEHLFKTYHLKLFSFAKRILKDDMLAREAVHDVLLRLWKRKDKIVLKKSLESYLVTSTKNQCINYLRLNKNDLKTISDTDLGLTEHELEFYQEHGILDLLISSDLEKKIGNVVKQLPPQQQKVFVLSRFEGLSSKEISENLDLTVRTVETHIYLALKFIREKIKDIMP
ncbi:MAG: RNA polymerase sigma-70 factor [Bacteroidales bacterium]|nr:RNA polymerase sigma-70 factor [Bacteroidales bacterium]